MTRHGIRLVFTLIYASRCLSTELEMEYLQANWAKEDTQVRLEPQPFAAVIACGDSNVRTWAVQNWGGTLTSNAYPTGVDDFAPGGGVNVGGFDDPAVNRWLARTHEPSARAQLRSCLYAYEGATAWSLPGI
jgi:hypothetical protein